MEKSLAEGDASSEVVAAEKQIEADLKAMIEVVSEMSDANSRSGRRGGQSPAEQRKEQDRIISELKMLRLLQSRVHQSTKDVDGKRATVSLNPALRKRIEYLEGRQEDVRDATERLAEERGDEVPQPE
jgi:flagellar motility protein MotE (MotC chaperone)